VKTFKLGLYASLNFFAVGLALKQLIVYGTYPELVSAFSRHFLLNLGSFILCSIVGVWFLYRLYKREIK
jgi:hypothetical protein